MSKVTFSAKSFTDALETIVENVTKVVANDLLREVKRRSPVKSGKFKKSWRMNGGNKKYSIRNPQPYGGKLEAGASRQAPNGVMAPAVRNLNQTLRRYER